MARLVREVNAYDHIAASRTKIESLARRPGPPQVGGNAIFEIKVHEDTETVIVEDWKFHIPSELEGAVLVDCEAWVTTPASAGTVTVQLRNETAGVNMLSTALTIDTGEKDDDDAGTPFAINGANAGVSYKDEIWVRVTSSGTGAMGLGVKVAFTPNVAASIALQGAQGSPGGMSSFEGDWQTATGYTAGQVVVHNGIVYITLVDHTSGAASEPGVGVDWEDFWETLVDLPMHGAAHCNMFGNGYVVEPGPKQPVLVPFSGTIVSATLLGDVAGNAEVDIWKTDVGGWHPTSADSIVGSAPMTLTGQVSSVDSTLAGWTTDVDEDDILLFVVNSAAVVRRLSAVLKIVKGG